MAAINAVRDQIPDERTEARVLPLWRGPGEGWSVDVLAEGDLARLRDAVDRILADTGVRVPSREVRGRLRTAGANVDDEAGLVRFSPSLAAAALARVPRTLRLAGRDPNADLTVDGSLAWLGAAGPAAIVVDLISRERRASVSSDLADAARLVDAVPQLAFIGLAAGGPRDVATSMAETSKHVQVEILPDVAAAEALAEIAHLVAGDASSLRSRPLLSGVLDVDGSLSLDRLEAAAVLALQGIPVGVRAVPASDASAGSIAHTAAAAIGGAVCLQLLVPDAPSFVGCVPPADAWWHLAWVQLARSLRLPSELGAFPTGSAGSDWRAGIQGGLAATVGWMSPPDLFGGAGLRAHGRVSSPVAMLLDSELFDLVRQIPLGFDVDEETLAVQTIADVGPAEHFLGEQHTLRHFRETWMSRFMDTSTWEAWEEAGHPEATDHAAERAREILATHEPLPLAPGIADRIEEVIAGDERDR